MDKTYIFSMQEHLDELKVELNGLYQIMKKRELSRYEYRAGERSLQILVGACIGIAKNWYFSLTQSAPADAYSAFERLAQEKVATVADTNWRKIIGMRNALVHDYLNLDAEVIKTVIKQQVYKELLHFADQGLTALANK